jgi:hypothetical protein
MRGIYCCNMCQPRLIISGLKIILKTPKSDVSSNVVFNTRLIYYGLIRYVLLFSGILGNMSILHMTCMYFYPFGTGVLHLNFSTPCM